MEVFASQFHSNGHGLQVAPFHMVGDTNNSNFIGNTPHTRISNPFLGFKYPPPDAKMNFGIEIYPDQMYDYGNGQYYPYEGPNYSPDQCKADFVDQPLDKYEYQEPEENFISIDELQYNPSLLRMILPDKRELEKNEQVRKENADRKERAARLIKKEIAVESLAAKAQNKSGVRERSRSESVSIIDQEAVVIRVKDEEVQEDFESEMKKKIMNEADSDNLDDCDDVIFLDDDDDEIDENEVGEELNWMDLEEQEKQEFECFLCNKKVASNYNLRRHMMIHTGDRPFGCDICFKRFREFSDLKKHRRTHRTDKNFKCMACHKNIPSDTNATKCTACEQNDKKKVLPYGKFFLEDVPIFEGSDKKAFICPECDRIFGSRHNLRRHFMIHTGEKPYQCDVCEKPFREVSTLKKHMLTHSRIKLFKCFICDKEYNDYQAYVKHKNTHGTDYIEQEKQRIAENSNSKDSDDEDYLFECNECRKRFLDVSLYKAHLKVHSHDFTFQCYICKKMFKKREKLNSHFVTHRYEVSDSD